MSQSGEASESANRGRRLLLLAAMLGITQTIGYGTMYYSFGVLAPDMARSTGFSLTSIFGLFSLSLAASGFAAPRLGRLLDRQSPALVMTFGTGLCSLMLVLWALIPGKAAFAILVILVELSSILVLYEAAFVAAARLVQISDARRTITGITFVAGFASTVFWPLTQWLGSFLDWREVYLVYAALQLAVCLPLHVAVWRYFPLVKAVSGTESIASEELGSVREPKRRRQIFILLMVGFAAQSFVIAAIHLHLIGILGGLGLAGSAAFIGALLGPSQVAARVAEFAGSGRFSIRPALIFCAVSLPISLGVLLVGAPAIYPAMAFAVIFGAGQGLSYVIRGILPLQIFGRKGYGELTGWFNSARLYVASGAPFATAYLFEHGGVSATLWFLIFLALVAGLFMVAALALQQAQD